MLLEYQTFHRAYTLVLLVLLVFETKKVHLWIWLLVVGLNTTLVAIFRGCPMTKVERWISTKNNKTLQELDIGFECEHEYKTLIQSRLFLLAAVILKLVHSK